MISYTPISVLMISSDISAFDKQSSLFRRLRTYADRVALLQVLVTSPIPKETIHDGTLHIVCVSSSSLLTRFFYLVKCGEQIDRPSFVTAQDPFFLGTVGWLLSRYHRVPLELQVHTDVFSRGFIYSTIPNMVRAGIARLLLLRASHIRAVSERIATSLFSRGISQSNVTVLPVPLGDQFFVKDNHVAVTPELPHCSKIVLMVSRLTKEKRVILGIQSLARARSQGNDMGLVIVGDGPERSRLQHEVKKLGLQQSVLFVGNISDVRVYYHSAHVFLHTAAFEGYGLVLVEAALLGLPIISTDVGIATRVGARIIEPQVDAIVTTLTDTKLSPAKIDSLDLLTTEETADIIVSLWERFTRKGFLINTQRRRYLLFKYVISGGSATAVDLSLLYILTDYFGVWYLVSASIAYLCGFAISFVLQKFWTFRNGAFKKIHTQFILFLFVGLINVILNALLLYLVVEKTQLHYLPAQLVVGVAIATWSFLIYRVLFRHS